MVNSVVFYYLFIDFKHTPVQYGDFQIPGIFSLESELGLVCFPGMEFSCPW